LPALCFITFVLFINIASAQSPNGTVSGIVLDPSGGIIAGADVLIINDDTGVQYPGKVNSEGYYVVPNISPGTYRIQVSNRGFKTIIKPDIVVHVEDALAINFTLPIGAASEIVTVEGGAPIINTENAAVSTVVDQTYVSNMPLNGRSFQDLILLTPGVVTNNPQSSGNIGVNGEFSVNGQRTESNYYTVDGVSANGGIQGGNAKLPATGSLPVSTTLGTTQGLVSVDALQEFRVSSSTYSAEYGRSPGGQFSFVTRSGANEWHGSAFDYLRNDVFDANDWFNDFFKQTKPPLRQNDFGGTLGGPVEIPRVYNGKDKTFFFFSYEGLRLLQPHASSISYVPDTALRQSAPAVLQPILNAFPVQNGPEALKTCSPTTDPTCPPSGQESTGLAEFIGTSSNPSHLNSYSVRFDHTLNQKLKLFFRFADTSSTSSVRPGGNFFDPSNPTSNAISSRTYTLGATSLISPRINNEFHLNYSLNQDAVSSTLDGFGGAKPADLFQLQGFAPGTRSASVQVQLFFAPFFTGIAEQGELGKQGQWNIVDTVALSLGRHQVKFGVDFRRLAPVQSIPSPLLLYRYSTASSVQANTVAIGEGLASAGGRPTYINFSAFAQDEWHIKPRLNLSLGLRWEVNPAPGAAGGNVPYTVEGSSLATLKLAPQGTPLWKTTWYNFAPRLGVAYVVRDTPGYETVVRGGGGVFFDTGQQTGSFGFVGPGFSARSLFGLPPGPPAGFPQPPSQVVPPIVNPPVAPYNAIAVAFPAHLQLPYTLQWNVSIEQSLGKSQAVTVSYVGANGRRLLGGVETDISSANANFQQPILFFQNGLTSDYNSLQAQYQRRLARGLQVLASYTWAHSIDYGSQNADQRFTRGNSDFDVRHTFSGAFSYDLPFAYQRSLARVLLHHWGFDSRFSARTAFPVFLGGTPFTDPVTGQTLQSGLNVVQGKPFYLYGPQYPGGRSVNPDAFANPACDPNTGACAMGDAPRNFVRGFGAWQIDLAARREFPIHERLKLQFRAEAFNVFNHPNFGLIDHTLGDPTFGQATATLAASLGVLSPLYQTGGPRSMQFALKLIF
jgi:hypothetical protein